MKKILVTFVSFICLAFSLSSCEATFAATQPQYQYDNVYIEDQDVDINLIFTYGTPVYYDGYLNYYYYNGWYYYPFFYNNSWYFRPYKHHYLPGYFPRFGGLRHGDFRFNGNKRGFGRPNGRYHGRPHQNKGGFNYNHHHNKGGYDRNHNVNRSFPRVNSSPKRVVAPHSSSGKFGGSRSGSVRNNNTRRR